MRMSRPWFVYLVETADRTLYCGISPDVKARVQAHNDGTARCKYTKGRRPVRLVAISPPYTRSKAAARERLIKTLKPHQKALQVRLGPKRK
jgi:putative endonuclease